MTKIKLQNVRNEFKNVVGTISHCISVIYSEYDNLSGDILTILPATKKQAMEQAGDIYKWGNVGAERIIKRKTPAGVTTIITTIKPSVDMVLRYYVKKYNEAHEEKKVKGHKTKQVTKKKSETSKPKRKSASDKA